MKKAYLSGALGLVTGLAIGAAVGYNYARKQSEKYIEEEISAIRDIYEIRCQQHEKELFEQYAAKRQEDIRNEIAEEAIAKDTVPDDQVEEYEELAGQYTADEEREYEHVYTISKDEYEDGRLGYDQLEFVLYDGDDVMVDEEGSVVDDYDFLADLVDEGFGKRGAPVDTCYIRNDDQGIDCLVTKVKGSYSHLVLGVPEPEEDDAPRKMRAYYD